MSNILNDLGIDEDDLDWFHLAICRGMDTNLFYEKYESDANVARNIEEICFSCPVMKMCYESGVDNNEYGVWGGVYFLQAIKHVRGMNLIKPKWNERLVGTLIPAAPKLNREISQCTKTEPE